MNRDEDGSGCAYPTGRGDPASLTVLSTLAELGSLGCAGIKVLRTALEMHPPKKTDWHSIPEIHPRSLWLLAELKSYWVCLYHKLTATILHSQSEKKNNHKRLIKPTHKNLTNYIIIVGDLLCRLTFVPSCSELKVGVQFIHFKFFLYILINTWKSKVWFQIKLKWKKWKQLLDFCSENGTNLNANHLPLVHRFFAEDAGSGWRHQCGRTCACPLGVCLNHSGDRLCSAERTANWVGHKRSALGQNYTCQMRRAAILFNNLKLKWLKIHEKIGLFIYYYPKALPLAVVAV